MEVKIKHNETVTPLKKDYKKPKILLFIWI